VTRKDGRFLNSDSFRATFRRRPTAELLDLAREIRARVLTHFGIELVPEPVFWGCSL
jgi:hypothetical protein